MLWWYEPDGLLRWNGDLAGQRTINSYDADGNTSLVTAAGGITSSAQTPLPVTQTYDAFGQLASVAQPKWGASGCTVTTTLAYDLDGNLASRAENAEAGSCSTVAARTQTFTFDALGRPTLQVDDAGTPGGATWVDDRQITWTYDPLLGFETERVINKAASSSTWALEQRQLSSYTLNGLLATLQTKNASDTLVQDHTLSYEQGSAPAVFMDGNRTKDVFTLKGPSGNPTSCESSACTATWTYDARGRLMQEVTGTGTTTNFTLDAIGNVTSEVTGSTTTNRSYVGQRLVQSSVNGASTKYYISDASGNLDCISSTASCSTGTEADYAYDYRNRLVYEWQQSGHTTTFTYDPLDRQVQLAFDGAITTHHYLGAGSDTTSDCSQSGCRKYGYAADGGIVSLTREDGSRFTYVLDARKSVSQILDSVGVIVESDGYAAYGSTIQSLTGLASGFSDGANEFGYSGRRRSGGSGVVDMGARQYLPSIQRFVQRDVYALASSDLGLLLSDGARNRYALTGGDPINRIEVDGHTFVPIDCDNPEGCNWLWVDDSPAPNPQPSPPSQPGDLETCLLGIGDCAGGSTPADACGSNVGCYGGHPPSFDPAPAADGGESGPEFARVICATFLQTSCGNGMRAPGRGSAAGALPRAVASGLGDCNHSNDGEIRLIFVGGLYHEVRCDGEFGWVYTGYVLPPDVAGGGPEPGDPDYYDFLPSKVRPKSRGAACSWFCWIL